MLLSFTVENYKSFKDQITIDFRNTHDYKFNNQCIKNGLLSKAVIYGPNASGKSNLGFALFDIVGLLTDKNVHPMQYDELSFLNADSNLTVATFKYVFQYKKDIITYLYKKKSPKLLSYEELYVNDELIYSYDFITGIFNKVNLEIINAENLNLNYLENNFAILRFIANNTNQPEGSYVKFIIDFVSRMLWFRSLQENGYIGFMSGKEVLSDWLTSNNLVKEFQVFMNKLGGINKELEVLTINQPMEQKILIEKHKNKILVFDNISSSGTKALELLFYWTKKFNDVSFLFMDEFDAFYHYDLARNVIKYIVDFDNIQVILTTHNANLASNEILRPDCYFTLDKGKLTSFIDSTEKELREGHNLEKMLRNGEFDE